MGQQTGQQHQDLRFPLEVGSFFGSGSQEYAKLVHIVFKKRRRGYVVVEEGGEGYIRKTSTEESGLISSGVGIPDRSLGRGQHRGTEGHCNLE